MGMLAGMLGGSGAAAGGSAAAGASAAAPAVAGTAAGTAASAAAPSIGSQALGALRKAGTDQIKSIESQSAQSSPNPTLGGSGLEGLYNVGNGSPQTGSHQVAPVMNPDDLLKNRNLGIGGGYGRT
jgi:hypothetical protein